MSIRIQMKFKLYYLQKNPANVEKAINMIETQANKGASDGLALKFDILHNYGVDLKGNQVSHSDAVNFFKRMG